jgi:hypothetical protein
LKKTALILVFLFYTFAHSQSVRKYSNEFMNIGVDAAALGMANVVTANTTDVNSGYWNPAGLMQLDKKQVALMHASYFANIAQYDYAAYAAPIDSQSAWGISAIRFGVDNILNTTQLIDNQGNVDYNRVSLFSTADYGFTFSYARKTKINNLNYGANAKVIRRVIGNFAGSWGFGFDFGLQYKINDWKMGVMIRDISTTYNVWNIDETEFATIKNAIPGQNQELPETTEISLPKAQIGFSKKYEFKNDISLLTAINFNFQFAQTNEIISSKTISGTPAIGFEGGYNDLVFIRLGVGNFQKITQIDNTKKTSFEPNLGIGFQFKGIQLDYALTNLGNQSAALYSNIFSLKVDLEVFK